METIDKWLFPYPQAVQDACRRLATDPVTGPLWGVGYNTGDFRQFVFALDAASDRDDWDRMPQRERNEWWKDFEKTADRLLQLMEVAPIPPREWGFPIRDVVLMDLLRSVGMEIPERGHPKYLEALVTSESKADQMGFTIANLLRWYAAAQRSENAHKQILKKPRDAKADRAHFIVAACRYTSCSDATIAAVAAVVFEDPSIDAKLIHRLRPAEGFSRN